MTADADTNCAEAMRLQLAGDLDQAERLYRAVLESDPRHAAANYCIGMLKVQLQRPADGLPYLLAALESKPETFDYWLGYLEALLHAGRTDEAAAALALARQHGLAGPPVEGFAQRLEARCTLEPSASKPDAPSSAPSRA